MTCRDLPRDDRKLKGKQAEQKGRIRPNAVCLRSGVAYGQNTRPLEREDNEGPKKLNATRDEAGDAGEHTFQEAKEIYFHIWDDGLAVDVDRPEASGGG